MLALARPSLLPKPCCCCIGDLAVKDMKNQKYLQGSGSVALYLKDWSNLMTQGVRTLCTGGTPVLLSGVLSHPHSLPVARVRLYLCQQTIAKGTRDLCLEPKCAARSLRLLAAGKILHRGWRLGPSGKSAQAGTTLRSTWSGEQTDGWRRWSAKLALWYHSAEPATCWPC